MFTQLQHAEFETHGFVRLRGVFTAAQASAMEDTLWRALQRKHAVSSEAEENESDKSGAASPLRVVELTGEPGDVVIAHPWLLHSASPNRSETPRFMTVQRVYQRGDMPGNQR